MITLVALGVGGLLFGVVARSLIVLRRNPRALVPSPPPAPRRVACATCPAAGLCQSGAVPECETRSQASTPK